MGYTGRHGHPGWGCHEHSGGQERYGGAAKAVTCAVTTWAWQFHMRVLLMMNGIISPSGLQCDLDAGEMDITAEGRAEIPYDDPPRA